MPKIMIELTWMMQLRRVKTLQIDWDNQYTKKKGRIDLQKSSV